MKLGQTAIIYVVAKFAGAIIGFIAMVYLARELGPETIGYYSLILAIVTWLEMGMRSGFSKAITKRVSEGEEPEKYISAGALLMLGMLSLIIIFLTIFRDHIDSYVGVQATYYIVILVSISLFARVVKASLKGKHMVHFYAIVSSVNQSSRGILQIILVAVGFGLTGMLFGYAIGGLLAVLLGMLIVGFRPKVPSFHHFKNLFDFAKYSWLGNMRAKSFSEIDIIFLGIFVSPSLVGIYSIAWTVSKFMDVFSTAISTTLFPEMSKLSSQGTTTQIINLSNKSFSYAGLFLIPAFMGSIILGREIMMIYGSEFIEGHLILTILFGSVLVYSYNIQALNTLNAIDRPDLSFKSNGLFIISNIILNILLIYLFGWHGAAIATLISACIGLLISIYYLKKTIRITIPIYEIGRQWIASSIMGITIYAVVWMKELQNVQLINEIYVFILVTIGALTYFLMYSTISVEFRNTVVRNIFQTEYLKFRS